MFNYKYAMVSSEWQTSMSTKLFIQGLEKPRDALTGMATPAQGMRKFQEELTRLQRHRIAFSVVMLTIGNLAEINTRMGHVIGQTMLKNVAAQIKQHLDITDFCSRYSLDRILVVLQNAIGVIMGANIGTSVTNTLVSIGHIGRTNEFKKAFAASTVHDFFNLICVSIMFPVELITGKIFGVGFLDREA